MSDIPLDDSVMVAVGKRLFNRLQTDLLATVTDLGYSHYIIEVKPGEATIQLWQGNLMLIQCTAMTMLEAIEGALGQTERGKE